MPDSSVYTQTATYWGTATLDGFGTRTYAAPALIKVRWEDKNQLLIGGNNEQLASSAVVYVQQDMKNGEYLALGDKTATSDPNSIDDAMLIQQFQKIPSVSGDEYIRKAIL